MSKRPTGLGKGLDNLIPGSVLQDQLQRANVVENIPVVKIKPNQHQPRKEFKPEAIQSLAASIKEHGILQPLVVNRTADGYELIAGERRWRAAKLAGLSEVPVLVRSSTQQQKLEFALIENLQRDDLSILETAEAFSILNQQFNLTHAQIATRVSKSLSSVKNIIRLLALPQKAKEALRIGTITEGHARQVLAVRDPIKQQELLDLIISRRWSVRQAEQFAKSYKEQGSIKQQAMQRVVSITPLTKRWQRKLGVPVRLQHTAHHSRLIIDFPDEKSLERWTEQLF